MPEMISTRTGYGKGMMRLAKEYDDIIVTSADTFRSFALADFVSTYPDKYYEFGIAEQNMITASAAMAAEGYRLFCVGYSPFLSMRALEQIRTFSAYPNLNVKIVSGLSGLAGDTDGVTHQGTEDIGIVRTIPNMHLICPADAVAAEKFVDFCYEIDGPFYLRLGRGATPVIYDKSQKFKYGKSVIFRDYGHDAVIIATGPCVYESGIAADLLYKDGIKATVIDMHTIKPLDGKTIEKYCPKTTAVFTVEDGSIYGGLGGAVAEHLIERHLCPDHFVRLGLTTFGTSGTLPELLRLFGLDGKSIAKKVKETLR